MQVALGAGWTAGRDRICACLPRRLREWPASLSISLCLVPEDGRGRVTVALPAPLSPSHEALVA